MFSHAFEAKRWFLTKKEFNYVLPYIPVYEHFHAYFDFSFFSFHLDITHFQQSQMDASNPKQQALSSDEPMKITNLHDFCLMKIFEYLDFRSLFNVAVANRQLRPAATSICISNFGIKTVHLGNDISADFTPQNGKMTVNGLKMCLPFLRCFGSSIENLFIFHHNFNEKQCNYTIIMSTNTVPKHWLTWNCGTSEMRSNWSLWENHLSPCKQLKLSTPICTINCHCLQNGFRICVHWNWKMSMHIAPSVHHSIILASYTSLSLLMKQILHEVLQPQRLLVYCSYALSCKVYTFKIVLAKHCHWRHCWTSSKINHTFTNSRWNNQGQRL